MRALISMTTFLLGAMPAAWVAYTAFVRLARMGAAGEPATVPALLFVGAFMGMSALLLLTVARPIGRRSMVVLLLAGVAAPILILITGDRASTLGLVTASAAALVSGVHLLLMSLVTAAPVSDDEDPAP